MKVICYDSDCEQENEYTDDDIYEYYDAQFGLIHAVECKSCGLTNGLP